MARTTVWTRYAEARMMNAALRGVLAFPQPTELRVALMQLKAGVDVNAVPGRDDVVEVGGTHPSYARQPLGSTTIAEPAAPGIPSVVNDGQVLFPEAATAWGTIAALGIFDTANNLWAVIPSQVADRRTIRVGDRLAVPAGEIVITGYDG